MRSQNQESFTTPANSSISTFQNVYDIEEFYSEPDYEPMVQNNVLGYDIPSALLEQFPSEDPEWALTYALREERRLANHQSTSEKVTANTISGYSHSSEQFTQDCSASEEYPQCSEISIQFGRLLLSYIRSNLQEMQDFEDMN
ncbi:hypothetical protein DSO57_1012082 [Entomophthora muscae]|uniref:Uncharacterized protein n=1 Tax=Entomophthora muscae TaxID=34485 RepID=A0ACC2TTI7_9FUNG|nr:hypothetical protein DSO57_1012082 [Entomophthora muscae]